MANIESVFTDKGIPPIGPYSQAIKANGFVFVSGQMPATFEAGKLKLTEGTVADKAHSLCRNAAIVLEAAGSSLEKVVKVTVRPELNGRDERIFELTGRFRLTQVFFTDLNDFAEFNEVYAQYFPQKPARSAIEARRLPAGVTLEMEVTAVQ